MKGMTQAAAVAELKGVPNIDSMPIQLDPSMSYQVLGNESCHLILPVYVCWSSLPKAICKCLGRGPPGDSEVYYVLQRSA